MASRGAARLTWRDRCINCSLSIPRNQKTHTLEEVSSPIFNLLQSWIAPTQLTSDHVLCTECLTLLQDGVNTTSVGSLALPAFGHRRVCFSCGRSIVHAKRTYPVRQDRQERNIIIRLVPLHLISRLERVCAACWRSAEREVRRHNEQDSNRSGLRGILTDAGSSADLNIPQLPPTDAGSSADLNISQPPPTDAGSSADLNIPQPPPTDAGSSAGLNIPQPPPALPQLNYHTPQITTSSKIKSSVYRRAASTSNHCIFVNCFETERLRVPLHIKQQLLLNYKFYVPPAARICRHHLNHGRWSELTSQLRDFTGRQFDIMMNMMRRAARFQRRI